MARLSCDVLANAVFPSVTLWSFALMGVRAGPLVLAVSILQFALGVSGVFAQNSPGNQPDCTSTLFSSSAACRDNTDASRQNTSLPTPAAASENTNTGNAGQQQIYIDSAGSASHRPTPNALPNEDLFPPDPVTDMQRLARSSTGELLPIFGRDLFQHVPSTFAPADQIAGTPDYRIGPGDEILVRLWGPETINSQLTVDPTGTIYLPKIGAIQVAGLRYDELQNQIGSQVDRIYKNYQISVSLGRLRSIQVYVVGEARRPGAYTVSSLSTVLNALFVSGGPNVEGSLRHIQVRRAGQTFPEFDLYDLVLRGDKSKDIRLETGDTIFIPTVGAQVALGGSVRHPAIYELNKETTLADVLALGGGFSATAALAQISLERIQDDRTRHAMRIALDNAGRGMALKDGDVLFAGHITSGYENSVTIRGNLANPGRFAWHEGMRLSDIIPDRMSLLTNGYWTERNLLGVPVPLFESTPAVNPAATSSALANARGLPSEGVVAANSPAAIPQPPPQESQNSTSPPEAQNKIVIPAAEIDWSYAVIERLDSNTLRNSLVPFNLGKLVQDRDPAQDLELRPGDIVTVLSQSDVLTPVETQTKYVRLEGEFAASGVYTVGPNETLDQVVGRAGGITEEAYLYGSSFSRESARVFQQQRLDEYVSSLSADMERASAVRAASAPTGVLDPNALGEQRTLVAQLRQLRATGRVVLEFAPESAGNRSVPKIPLENGDVFRVPSRPDTVNVIGAVYGQNVFLYNPGRKLRDYVALAGNPTRIADSKHAFIIRADGSIYSRRQQRTFSNGFESTAINPGDSIVIPEKPIKPTAMRDLLDYSQVLSSFGLAAAAINVVK